MIHTEDDSCVRNSPRPAKMPKRDAGTPVHWGARGFGVVVCASATCPDAVRCAARRRRVAEAIKRAPPDRPCACVAGACDAAGLARAFARLDGDESLCRVCG